MPGPSANDFGDDDDDAPAAGLVAKAQAGDNAAPLTITEISSLLKRAVEDRFGFVRLRGELSGVKRAASGHLYCCLKDEGAVIDGVMWRTGAQRLGFVPEDGIEVVASGKLTTYPGRSKYQIVSTRWSSPARAPAALLEKTRRRSRRKASSPNDRKRPLQFLTRLIGSALLRRGGIAISFTLADRFHRCGGPGPCSGGRG